MLLLRFLLPDEAGAGGGGASEEPAAPSGDELPGGLPANDPNGEGTTPEEVAAAMKSAGVNLPAEPKAPVAADDEEGEDPDKAEEPAAPPKGDEETSDDEPEDEEEEPEPKPAAPEEPAADDNKYSFQVEDANGVTYKISADANVEDVLAEFEPKNNGQIISILDQLREVKAQKATDDAKAAEDSVKAERTERAGELLKGWGEEAKALQGAKRIPDGADGETRINKVYEFMADENTKRIADNKPTLNSFEDALDKLENKEARDKAVADAKADKDKARENGGKVGGASAPASSSSPVYKAGSAKNANQAIRSMNLL